MNYYNPPLATFAVLDYERPEESRRCLESIRNHAKFKHEILYISNGGKQDYVWGFYNEGLIDKLVLNRTSEGCGIGTRQAFQSAITPYIFYIQCDQFLICDMNEDMLNNMKNALRDYNIFYIDLAGNQGQGNPSERALFMQRKRYLEITGINDIIGGPGPYAQYKWTEKHLQDYMKDNGVVFLSTPLLFADNGKVSIREYGEEYGGKTMHYTDTKELTILKPFKKRADGFPNLNLNDKEWDLVLNNQWVNGTIPEADKAHSFKVW